VAKATDAVATVTAAATAAIVRRALSRRYRKHAPTTPEHG
jgi:hypothetical protein